jgi:acyl dehydratase
MRNFLFPVDASHVLQFARAIGDPSPVFSDPDYVAVARLGELTPPPTFLIAADHFDPECPRRPAMGEAWPGSGRITEGWVRPEGQGQSRGRGLHAEEVFEYTRHPRVGELLTVEVSPGAEWEKLGRRGTLRFREVVSDYRDAAGAPVATARWIAVAIDTSTSPAGGDTPRAEERSDEADQVPATAQPSQLPDPAPALPTSRLRPGDAMVGDRWSDVVVDDLTLAQLVRYAGASGDFIALHHDERIAQTVGGYDGVFAHGMLTMGLSGQLLTALVETERLRRFSGRMVAIVSPGDTLTTTVTVDAVRPAAADAASEIVDLSLITTKQDGTVALSGAATATI